MIKYKTVEEVSDRLKELEKELKYLYHVKYELSLKKTKKNRSDYQKKKELLNEGSKLYRNMLKLGDRVKITGARSGKYRVVKEVMSNSFFGMVVPEKNQYIETFDIRECGLNKITHWKHPETGEWISTKRMLENPELWNYL